MKVRGCSVLNIITILFALLIFRSYAEATQPMIDFGYEEVEGFGVEGVVGLKDNGTVISIGLPVGDEGHISREWIDVKQVAVGNDHAVCLSFDGTVKSIGLGTYGQRDIYEWRDIRQIDVGAYHTVGLKANGTVVAVGRNIEGQTNVGAWESIVQVASGNFHTVGLKSDGTVVAVGSNGDGELNVGSWTKIKKVFAGAYVTIGLKLDGSVVATGRNTSGQLNVSSWSDIVQIATREDVTVGLKSDGLVVAVGNNDEGQLNVGSLTDIVQVAYGSKSTIGIKTDGTVVTVGLLDWKQMEMRDWDLKENSLPQPIAELNDFYLYDIMELPNNLQDEANLSAATETINNTVLAIIGSLTPTPPIEESVLAVSRFLQLINVLPSFQIVCPEIEVNQKKYIVPIVIFETASDYRFWFDMTNYGNIKVKMYTQPYPWMGLPINKTPAAT